MSNFAAGALGVHDAGGATDFGATLSLEGALERSKEAFAQWEIEVCALAIIMSKKGYRVVDESRRTMELLPPARYGTLSYWAKWACGTAQLALGAKLFTQAELDEALGGAADHGSQQLGGSQPDGPRFCAGESVRVRSEGDRVRWRRPHLRTPGYIHGAQGVVVRVQGPYANPEEVAFYSLGPKRTDAYLYTVRFYQRALWAHYAGGEDDTIDVDVYEGWLEGAAHTTPPHYPIAVAPPPPGSAKELYPDMVRDYEQLLHMHAQQLAQQYLQMGLYPQPPASPLPLAAASSTTHRLHRGILPPIAVQNAQPVGAATTGVPTWARAEQVFSADGVPVQPDVLQVEVPFVARS